MLDAATDPSAPPDLCGVGVTCSAEQLLEQVAAGDRNAFAELYDRMAPGVYGMACRVVVDASIAEEVTQEVLLAVWSRAQSFDRSRGSARSWILTMAHHRAVDVVRREQAARNREQRVAAASIDRPADDVADAVVQRFMDRSRARDVDRALCSLTVLQRSAVELAYFSGFTYREVAQSLAVPLGTAKTRIRDGLRRLTDELGAGAAPTAW